MFCCPWLSLSRLVGKHKQAADYMLYNNERCMASMLLVVFVLLLGCAFISIDYSSAVVLMVRSGGRCYTVLVGRVTNYNGPARGSFSLGACGSCEKISFV